MFIVIDGLDGCGKSTQLELLKEKIPDAKFITFPYYETNSGKIVTDYLHGKFPEKSAEISAYSASAIYAVDRYTSFKTHWGEFYNSPMLIAGRYTTSNAIYQMTKLEKSAWESYLDWLYDFEYTKLGLPRPDLTIFLDMPIEISQELMSERYNGDETKKDIHEQNISFLKACREAALYVANRDNWKIIRCDSNNMPRTINEINDELCNVIAQERIII